MEGRVLRDVEDMFLKHQEWLSQNVVRNAPTNEGMRPEGSLPVWTNTTSTVERERTDPDMGENALVQTFTESQLSKEREALDRRDLTFTRSGSCDTEVPMPRLHRLVGGLRFEGVSCLLIITNAILLGIEVEITATSPGASVPVAFKAVNVMFATFFLGEIALRMLAQGRNFYRSSQWLWNTLDVAIVVFSLVDVVMSYQNANNATNLTFLRIVRMTKIMRVIRVVRILKMFTQFRILVYSVLHTLQGLIWALVLLLVILFVFAVLFTQVVAEHLAVSDHDAELTAYYASLGKSLLTLFKSITGGVSWQDVAAPLSRVSPFFEGLLFLYIAFIHFAVFNVITGLFCQSAIENAQYDKDVVVETQLSMKQTYTMQLQDLFRSMDAQHAGHITLTTFEQCLRNDEVRAYLHGLDITVDDAWRLFMLLDTDESRSIDVEQFVTGCLKLRGSARNVDIHMLMYEGRWVRNRITDLAASLNTLLRLLPSLDSDDCMKL